MIQCLKKYMVSSETINDSLRFVFGLLVLRKTQNAIAAVRYVKRHGESVSQSLIENSPDFKVSPIPLFDQLFLLAHRYYSSEMVISVVFFAKSAYNDRPVVKRN